jgi:hypothetical protein
MACEPITDTDSEAESIHVLRFEGAKDAIQKVLTGDRSRYRFGFVLSFNQCNLECGAGPWKTSKIVTQVHSDQYPDLASHYSRKIAKMERWAGSKRTGQTKHERWKGEN